MHMRSCMRAYATLQKRLCHETIANLSSVLREHRAGCRLPPALLPARRNQSPDAVRLRNPSKSTLAHNAVAAAVSHKHQSIIRLGAGLIQFVHGAHSRLAMEATRNRNPCSPLFVRVFFGECNFSLCQHPYHVSTKNLLADTFSYMCILLNKLC